MRRFAQDVLAGVIAFGVLLGAAAALVLWTERLAAISRPFLHVLAMVAELLCGVPVLLGAVYIAAQTAVRIFARGTETGEAGPLRVK